jgi:hypothetical protein
MRAYLHGRNEKCSEMTGPSYLDSERRRFGLSSQNTAVDRSCNLALRRFSKHRYTHTVIL